MGTNLSQVFISNTDVLQTANTTFTTPTNATIGIWNLGVATPTYRAAALYSPGVDITDEVAGAASTTTDDLTIVANPLWLVSKLQFVQGTAGNPIATPIINTANIKRIKYDPYVATAGHKVVLTPNATFTSVDVNTVTIKVIVRSTPTDQLSFYDQNGSNAAILSGTAPFPLGAFNTTNHKVISVEFNCTNTATFISNGKTAIDSHELLKDLITATNTGPGTSLDLQSKHVGFVFDIIVLDKNGDSILVGSAASNKIVPTVTGQVLGVGNGWQVLGEEIRCRSRYGNFNRMYLPQNMPTYAVTASKYDKITIEYATNWPTATGIAPAGANNQVVLYYTDADGTAPVVGDSDNTFDTAFAYTVATASEFVW